MKGTAYGSGLTVIVVVAAVQDKENKHTLRISFSLLNQSKYADNLGNIF
jgi:hypothetical protein